MFLILQCRNQGWNFSCFAFQVQGSLKIKKSTKKNVIFSFLIELFMWTKISIWIKLVDEINESMTNANSYCWCGWNKASLLLASLFLFLSSQFSSWSHSSFSSSSLSCVGLLWSLKRVTCFTSNAWNKLDFALLVRAIHIL